MSLFGDATNNVTFYSRKTVVTFRNSKNISVKYLKIKSTAGSKENSGLNHLKKLLPTVLLSKCSDIACKWFNFGGGSSAPLLILR